MERNMSRTLSGFLLSSLISICAPVGATIINSTTGLTGPTNQLGFDSLGSGIAVTNQFASQGVVFTEVLSSTSPAPLVTLFSDAFTNMNQFALNQSGGSFQIQFQGTVDEAVFAFMTNSGTSSFSALLQGNVVESFSGVTNLTGRFFGFTGITFDSIEVNPGGQNQAFRLDNLQYGTVTPSSVPEPTTLALLGLGLAGIGFSRRKAT
jgi:hypothetical protein